MATINGWKEEIRALDPGDQKVMLLALKALRSWEFFRHEYCHEGLDTLSQILQQEVDAN